MYKVINVGGTPLIKISTTTFCVNLSSNCILRLFLQIEKILTCRCKTIFIGFQQTICYKLVLFYLSIHNFTITLIDSILVNGWIDPQLIDHRFTYKIWCLVLWEKKVKESRIILKTKTHAPTWVLEITWWSRQQLG